MVRLLKYPSKFEKGTSPQYQISLIKYLYKRRMHHEAMAKRSNEKIQENLKRYKDARFKIIQNRDIIGRSLYASPEDMDALYSLPHWKR